MVQEELVRRDDGVGDGGEERDAVAAERRRGRLRRDGDGGVAQVQRAQIVHVDDVVSGVATGVRPAAGRRDCVGRKIDGAAGIQLLDGDAQRVGGGAERQLVAADLGNRGLERAVEGKAVAELLACSARDDVVGEDKALCVQERGVGLEVHRAAVGEVRERSDVVVRELEPARARRRGAVEEERGRVVRARPHVEGVLVHEHRRGNAAHDAGAEIHAVGSILPDGELASGQSEGLDVESLEDDHGLVEDAVDDLDGRRAADEGAEGEHAVAECGALHVDGVAGEVEVVDVVDAVGADLELAVDGRIVDDELAVREGAHQEEVAVDSAADELDDAVVAGVDDGEAGDGLVRLDVLVVVGLEQIDLVAEAASGLSDDGGQR